MENICGEGFVDRSKCPLLSGNFSDVVNSINQVAYMNFKDGDKYLDDYMTTFAKGAKASRFLFKEYRPMPIEGFDPAKELGYYKREIDYERSISPDAAASANLG